ncbi:MAG TPA: response regulator [Nitrospirota bacterium]|nr:response regulator [Nitrospirota bacterium]
MSRKIMVVDDSASMRQMVSFTLGQEGFEIIEAANGGEALKKLDKETVHMLITDLNMPELDGISLVRIVRKNPAYKFIPIIILTTVSGSESRQEGKAAGATGWMVKPFKPEELIAAVKKVLR